MKQDIANGETLREYVARVMKWFDDEPEYLFDQFTDVKQLFEFAELWTTYGTDYFAGIMEGISEGDDPEPYNNFVRKWKLNELPEYKWPIVTQETAQEYF